MFTLTNFDGQYVYSNRL